MIHDRDDSEARFRILTRRAQWRRAIPILIFAPALALVSEVAVALPLTGAVQVAAGQSFSCALTGAGGVKCWGNGIGAAAGAVDVVGIGLGATAIVAGGYHACAIVAGGVQCWGLNNQGQLGNGTTTDSQTPVTVTGLGSGVIAIAAGGLHSCAVTVGGGLKCWGLNNRGQLGDGTTSRALVPVDVSGLGAGVAAVAAGAVHTCAVVNGGAKCWGYNNSGQLGIGPGIPTMPTPTTVVGLASGVTAIAAGSSHSCALVAGGGAKCWGLNTDGQVGNGSTGFALVPEDVVGLATGVTAISAGTLHTCALIGGGVKCWGANATGQLGDGSTTGSPVPIDVLGLTTGAMRIAAGHDHSCSVRNTGGVSCWGSNQFSQIGNGTTPLSSPVQMPESVPGITSEPKGLWLGYRHSCAVTSQGALKCWGWGAAGQLGTGTLTDSSTPVSVAGLSAGVIDVAAGANHTCALTFTATFCWGLNDRSQLGTGTGLDSPTPIVVSALGADAIAVSAGIAHACVLTRAGGVKCWGGNDFGQAGVGTTIDVPTPTDVVGLTSGVSQIASGDYHTCAVLISGGVRCWGLGSSGQIGNGGTSDALMPAVVTGLPTGAKLIAVGGAHTCTQLLDDTTWCWGANDFGQLGDGGGVPSSPTPLGDVTNHLGAAVAMEAGGRHTCVLQQDGRAMCWGSNEMGQIGNGTFSHAFFPTEVPGFASNVLRISAGDSHTCAVPSEGGLKCWGDHSQGQVGIGSQNVTVPTAVVLLACADFVDVAPTSAFCRNVEWLRNRAVTLGCALLNSYCPNELVNRLAMAAFMNRLGTALTGQVAWQEASQGAVDLDAGTVVCQTTEEPGVNHTRRAHVAGVFSGTAASTTGFGTALVASIDHGVTWLTLRPRTTRATAPANRWANARDSGQFDLEAGDAVRFGIRVSRDGLPGGADLTAGRCLLRALIGNRQSPISPFDPQ